MNDEGIILPPKRPSKRKFGRPLLVEMVEMEDQLTREYSRHIDRMVGIVKKDIRIQSSLRDQGGPTKFEECVNEILKLVKNKQENLNQLSDALMNYQNKFKEIQNTDELFNTRKLSNNEQNNKIDNLQQNFLKEPSVQYSNNKYMLSSNSRGSKMNQSSKETKLKPRVKNPRGSLRGNMNMLNDDSLNNMKMDMSSSNKNKMMMLGNLQPKKPTSYSHTIINNDGYMNMKKSRGMLMNDNRISTASNRELRPLIVEPKGMFNSKTSENVLNKKGKSIQKNMMSMLPEFRKNEIIMNTNNYNKFEHSRGIENDINSNPEENKEMKFDQASLDYQRTRVDTGISKDLMNDADIDDNLF